MKKPIISISNISKSYRLYEKPLDRLKQAIFKKRRYFHEHQALIDISFDMTEGEIIGLIGKNGSGKTTLLQIISGILTPTAGQIQRSGNLFALLELGSGFNLDFTGRENISINGMILGLKPSEIDPLSEQIIAFADIGDYIDEPVRTYSTGMHARLAMAIAVHISADLLLIDEILSVGDIFFQMKCFERVQSLINKGKTVLLCSHDLGAIRRYCSRAIYLEKGKLVADGEPDEVLELYLKSGEGNNSQETNVAPQKMGLTLITADQWQPDEEFYSLVRSPRGMAFVDGGNILVAELTSHSLIEVSQEGKVVGQWGKTGFTAGSVYDPISLETLPDGGVALADYTTGRLSVAYRNGKLKPLFEGLKISSQPSMLRFGPDESVWIFCVSDSSLWVVGPESVPRRILPQDGREWFIADIAFKDGVAYITDFRNHQILVFDAFTAEQKDKISLMDCKTARGPYGIVILNNYIIVTCHDSHSLIIAEAGSSRPEIFSIDLRKHLINNPCYLLVDGSRIYISASMLGGITAFDISSWPILSKPHSQHKVLKV
jgi:ABC-type polysaccharide/polyol phosphate transport system ATPase subunit